MYKLIRKAKDLIKELKSIEHDIWVAPWYSKVLIWINSWHYLRCSCGKFKYLNTYYSQEQMNDIIKTLQFDISVMKQMNL